MGGRRELTPRWEWVATVVVLAVPWVVVSVAFWPGHMNADSLNQLREVASGELTDQYAPVVQWIWSLLWPLGIGSGWGLSATALTLVVGAFLVLRSILRPLAAAVAAATIALTPQLLGYLGTVSRDTWFAALLLLSFGLLAEASRREGRGRLALLAAALGAGWLCTATRQNAGSATFVAFAVGAVLAVPWVPRIRDLWPGWSRPRRVAAAGLAGLAICLGCIGTQLLLNAAVGVEKSHPEKLLFRTDLDRIAEQKGEAPGGASSPDQGGASSPDEGGTRRGWLEAVKSDPLGYLDTRTVLLLDDLGITRTERVVYHPGIDYNEQGFVIRNPGANDVATDYLESFADDELDGTIIHRVWIYLLLCGLAAFAFTRREMPAPLVVAGSLGLAMFPFQLGLLFASISAQYRFEYVTVVAGAVLGVLLAAYALSNRYPRLRTALGGG